MEQQPVKAGQEIVTEREGLSTLFNNREMSIKLGLVFYQAQLT